MALFFHWIFFPKVHYRSNMGIQDHGQPHKKIKRSEHITISKIATTLMPPKICSSTLIFRTYRRSSTSQDTPPFYWQDMRLISQIKSSKSILKSLFKNPTSKVGRHQEQEGGNVNFTSSRGPKAGSKKQKGN